MIMPFFCYNKKDYCDHSENCDGCDVWVIGKGGKEVPSQSDRFRAMSDEELVAWAHKQIGCGFDSFPCGVVCNGKCTTYSDEECKIKIMNWLQQPAEDE
jgi:hypothetical protein